jgi:hypothetical protein
MSCSFYDAKIRPDLFFYNRNDEVFLYTLFMVGPFYFTEKAANLAAFRHNKPNFQFRPNEPPTISSNSLVMACCRDLLYCNESS